MPKTRTWWCRPHICRLNMTISWHYGDKQGCDICISGAVLPRGWFLSLDVGLKSRMSQSCHHHRFAYNKSLRSRRVFFTDTSQTGGTFLLYIMTAAEAVECAASRVGDEVTWQRLRRKQVPWRHAEGRYEFARHRAGRIGNDYMPSAETSRAAPRHDDDDALFDNRI